MGEFFANVLLVILYAAVGVLSVLAVWVIFVVLPVKLINEQDCLEAGYPKARTTVTLDTYCVSPYSSLGDTAPKVIPTP